MNIKIADKWKDKKQIIENLYLIILALHLIQYSFYTTMFNITWPDNYEWIILICTGAVVLLKAGYSEKYKGQMWTLGIIMMSVFAFSWLKTGRIYLFLIYTPLLILGAMDIDYKKILKVSFAINFYTLIISVVGSFTGCIENLVYGSENVLKNSFGTIYYTDFAAKILFLFLTAWLIWNNVPDIVFFILSLFVIFFVVYYNRARCSSIVLIFFCIITMFSTIIQYKKVKICNRIISIFDIAIKNFMTIASLGIIVLSYIYDENVYLLNRVNAIISARLQWGKTAINEYGITMFGTAFDQIGGGGTTVSNLDYNFVDSSYVLILLQYGILVLIVILFLYYYTCSKAISADNRRIAIVFALVALHSIIEHHFLEINYNIFLILPFASMKKTNKMPVQAKIKKNRYIYLCLIILILFCILFFPKICNVMRTLVTLLRLYDSERNIVFIFFGLLSLAFIIAFKFCMEKYFIQRKKRYIGGIVALLIILLMVCIKSNSIILNGVTEYSVTIEEERDVLNSLMEVMDKADKVYVDDVPEVYKKKFAHISNRILPIELCAYEENATIINPIEDELQALIEAGYYFGELSQTHGIYTSNERVAETLEKDGIQMSKCYSVRKDVDLQLMADLNDITLQDDGSLILEGSDKSLIYGPYLTIKKGHLRVEYDLELIDSTITQGKVATARVSFESGRTVWKEVDIPLEAFDENGEYKLIIDTLIWGNRSGIEFLLFADDGTILKVKDINYGKIEAD